MTTRRRPRTLDYERVAAMYRSGMTGAQIARELHVSHTTVFYALGALGIKTRQPKYARASEAVEARKQQNQVRDAAILALHREGLSVQEIQARLQLPRVRVYRSLHAAGIRLGRPSRVKDPSRVERMVELAIRIAKRRMRLCA